MKSWQFRWLCTVQRSSTGLCIVAASKFKIMNYWKKYMYWCLGDFVVLNHFPWTYSYIQFLHFKFMGTFGDPAFVACTVCFPCRKQETVWLGETYHLSALYWIHTYLTIQHFFFVANRVSVYWLRVIAVHIPSCVTNPSLKSTSVWIQLQYRVTRLDSSNYYKSLFPYGIAGLQCSTWATSPHNCMSGGNRITDP